MRLVSKVILAIVSSAVVLCSFVVPDPPKDHIEFRKECACYVYLTYTDDGKLRGWLEIASDTSHFLRHGYTYYFSGKGDTLDKTYYFFGEAQGLSYAFYENGDTAVIRKYSNGQYAGTWQYFDEQRHLFQEVVYTKPGPGDWPFEEYQEKYYDTSSTLFLIKNINKKGVHIQVLDTPSYNTFLDKRNNKPGKELFMQHCAFCHTADKDAVGPKLAGVTSKRTTPWLKSWIKDAYGMVQSGDVEAMALYEAWRKTGMPANDLTEQELDHLIQFLAQMNQK